MKKQKEILSKQKGNGVKRNVKFQLPSDDNLEQAYLAGYKKRAEMSNLEYDFASELYAKSHFIKWKSKRGN